MGDSDRRHPSGKTRCGPKRLILVESRVIGVGLLLAAHISAWWHLYLFFGGMCAIGISLSGWLPSVLITRGWFPTRMGTAVRRRLGGHPPHSLRPLGGHSYWTLATAVRDGRCRALPVSSSAETSRRRCSSSVRWSTWRILGCRPSRPPR
ncbi:MAG: hypothetical protein MZV70_63865 [Desulfobacterales bacterium]|nr:hypothetical protein [Desulfobacterales bacterium]